MANKYQRFGLRADRNLSDVPNPINALTNILEDLVVSQSDRFTASDLLVTKGLRETRVTSGRLGEINDTLPVYTPLGGGPNRPVEPFITIKDQIENFKVVAGDPPFLSGGMGPRAAKYSASAFALPTYGDQVDGASDPGVTSVEQVRGNATPENSVVNLDFWQNGDFQQSNKLHPRFPNQFGSVVWEGFTSVGGFELDAVNGCVTIEQDLYGLGEWETIMCVPYYRVRYTSGFIIAFDADAGQTTITFAGHANQPKSYFRGMRVYFYSRDNVTGESAGYVISDVENVGDDRVITIPEDLSGKITINIPRINIGFNPDTDSYFTDRMAFKQRYAGLYTKFKIAWFYPPLDSNLPFSSSGLDNKTIEFRFGAQDTIEYFYFYPDDPSLTSGRTFSYEEFLTKRLSDNVRTSTFDINSTQPILFDYEAPTTSTARTPTSRMTNTNELNLTETNVTQKRVIVSNSYNFNDNLDQGDYILYNNSNGQDVTVAQVYRITDNNTIYLDPNPDTEYGTPVANRTMNAFKKQGLIGIFFATTRGSDAVGNWVRLSSISRLNGQLFDRNDVAKETVLLGVDENSLSSNPHNPMLVSAIRGYTGGDNTVDVYYEALTPGAAVPDFTNDVIAVYASKGLHDNASPQQCLGVIAAEVASSTATSVTLTQSAASLNLAVGDAIQFGSNPSSATYSSQFIDNNTFITGISGNRVDFRTQPAGNIQIPTNSTVVFIRSAAYVSGVPKEFCVVPLNTAPPFISTDVGLTTPDNFGLEANSIEFTDLTVNTTSSVNLTSSITADGFLPIFYGDTRYKLLTNSGG